MFTNEGLKALLIASSISFTVGMLAGVLAVIWIVNTLAK